MQVSDDAGATWTSVTDLDLAGADGLRNLNGLAVSADGTVFLTTDSQGRVRIDTEGNATTSRLASFDHSVFVAGERVCLVTEAGRVDHLQCSTDDGLTWTPEPLPGFR